MNKPAWQQTLIDCGYPPVAVVIDWETYFNTEYSLKAMSTQEYVADERFEILGVSVHEQRQPYDRCQPRFWSAEPSDWRGDAGVETVIAHLQREYGDNLERCTVVAQNAYFEAAVLRAHFGITPPHIVDTMGLHRHVNARASHKLADIAKELGLEAKGDTMEFKHWTFRRRRAAPKGRGKKRLIPRPEPKITSDMLGRLAQYANLDVRLEWEVFKALLPRLSRPEFELRVMQHTLDIWTQPILQVDYEHGERLAGQMQERFDAIIAAAGMTHEEVSGNKSFEAKLTEVMAEIGEKPPYKPGKKGPVLAMAKDDPERDQLLQHPHEPVRRVAEARVAVKSWPNHIKRVQSIMAQCRATGDQLCVPLKYHGAHCVTGDHEVFTPDGWVRLDAWDGGTIMQWQPSGEMKFAPATANRFDSDEPMVRIDAPYVSALMTAGHTVARYGSTKTWAPTQAATLLDRSISYLPISGVWRSAGRITANQMRLLVAVQADGHWQTNKRYGRELRWGLTKPRKQKRLRALLTANAVPFREASYPSHPGEITFRVRWADCPGWLSPDRKQFGVWLLDSDEAAREAFLEELLYWDGGQHGRGNPEYYSCGARNHEWVRTVAHLSGIGAATSNNTTRLRTTRSPTQAIVKRKHVSKQVPVRRVYCPTTETGFWMVRHGGHIHITGNTGRWSGGEGINLQNLPARNPEAVINEIRGMIIAPPGHKLVVVDASQIEARVLAWEAGQLDLCERFAKGEEIYAGFAARVLGKPIRKARKTDPPPVHKFLTWARNSVGKVGILGCLAEGTSVLTDHGWKTIEQVLPTDRVWDGDRYVEHEGAMYQGVKECIQVGDVWLTPDHEVYAKGGWYQAHDLNIHNPQSEAVTANSRWSQLHLGPEAGSSPSNVVARAVEEAFRSEIIWSPGNLHAVMSVLKSKLLRQIHNMDSALELTVLGFVTEFLRSCRDAIFGRTRDTASEESPCILSGEETEQLFFDTLCRWKGGTIPASKSIESITTATTSRGTLDSSREVRICRTWDIIRAGSNRRYQAGNLIVANCGYGMGATKAEGYAGGAIDFATAERIVQQYRAENDKIVQYWSDLEDAFAQSVKYNRETTVGHLRIFPEPGVDDITVIELPCGRWLRYHKPRVRGMGWERTIKLWNAKFRSYEHTWGGSLTENVIQAMSRDLLAGPMIDISGRGWPVPLTVHDEIIAVVRDAEADVALQYVVDRMGSAPEWATGCPLASEGQIVERYGK